ADTIVLPGARTARLSEKFSDSAILLALAATARHALAAPDALAPDLIIGHGAFGRLMARIAVAQGAAPTVWERSAARRDGAEGYAVCDPDDDPRADYASIYDASGDAGRLDDWIGRIAKGGTVTLAGFYDAPVRFAFPPAFAREMRLRIAAEWTPDDLAAVVDMVDRGALSLDGIVSHRCPAADAAAAYATAFTDPDCLKMTLDWRAAA
ncbi:MAG: chlorophyll synthesis pathway protein BchC, partial [Pseudomonadota bacterium]